MRTRNCLALCALAAAAVGMWAFGPAGFAGEAKYNWKFANYYIMPETDEYLIKFCDKITEYSNGEIVFRFYPNAELGTHDENFHAVQEGSLQMAHVAPYVHLVPGGMVNWMPWTVSTRKEFDLAFEPGKGPIWKVMPTVFAEAGVYPLFYRGYGGYGIGNRIRPLKTPADFKDLKFRVSGSLGFVRALENMAKGSGATFETLPYGESYNALSKGVVDSLWSHWPQLLLDRHGEVLNYFTDLCWAWDANAIIMNLDEWNGLPDHLKDAISRASAEMQVELSAFEDKAEKEMIETIKKQMPHLEIFTPTAEEREVFRQASNMPAIWDELCRPWLDAAFPGQNMTEKLQAELEDVKVRAAAASK